MLKKYFLILFITLCYGANICAQNDSVLNSLTTKALIKYNYLNGLSNDNVTSIAQDNFGFIWIATENGLNRFDGYEFVNYFVNNKQIKLPSNNVQFLRNFGNNQLGISTTKGFVLFDTKNYTSKVFRVPDTTAFDIFVNNNWGAVLLSNKRIALSTCSGFYVFDSLANLIFRYDEFTANDVDKKRILYGREIFELGNNEYIVFANENNVAYYNSKTNEYVHEIGNNNFKYPVFSQQGYGFYSRNEFKNGKFLFTNMRRDTIVFYDKINNKQVLSKLPFNVIKDTRWYSKILAIDDTSYLLNARAGFYKLKLNALTGKIFIDTNIVLKDLVCTQFFIDKEKRLWIGTRNGLYMQRKTKTSIQELRLDKVDANKDVGYINTILRYRDKYYVGKYAKYDSGLIIVNAITLKIEKKIIFFNAKDSWNEIRSIQQYYQDTLWIATNAGIVWFNVNNYKYGKLKLPVSSADTNSYELPILYPADKYGNAWILYFMQGVVTKFNLKDRSATYYNASSNPALPFKRVKHIVFDSFNNVWIGGHGLSRYNYNTNKFDTLINVYAGSNKFNDDITAMTADGKGFLWLQTADNNLIKYDITNRKYIVYNEQVYFPNGAIESFSKVIDKHIWMLQAHKLISIDENTSQIKILGNYDGLPDDDVSSKTIYYDSLSKKLIAIYNNFIGLIPIAIGSQSQPYHNILFTNVEVDANQYQFGINDKLNLEFGVKQVSINFTIIDFETAEQLLFYYKLNNDSWLPIKYNRVIQLNNLKAGSYEVFLKAVDKYGEEAIKKITIVVATPYWQSWWFRMSCLLVLAMSIFFLLRYRIKIIKHKANIDNKLADYEMKALHTQMNPHFIFNSLGTIKSMILENRQGQANKYLGKFAKMIRLTLNHSTESFISLQQNNEYIQHYIEIENLRFNNAFSFEIVIDNGIDSNEVKIPPMMIQPLVENAIWHGLLNKEGDKKLRLRYSLQNKKLICSIEDNGVGLMKAETKNKTHKSVGIDNIRQRLLLLNEKYKIDCSLTIRDKMVDNISQAGTVATITLPYIV